MLEEDCLEETLVSLFVAALLLKLLVEEGQEVRIGLGLDFVVAYNCNRTTNIIISKLYFYET